MDLDHERLQLKPAPGRRVLDPLTRQPLPAEGADVERSTYWFRRLLEGDVTAVRAPDEAAVKPAKK